MGKIPESEIKQPGTSILIVDDDAPLVGSLKDILEGQGYDVDSAFDGQTAIEACRARDFGLIMVDIKLPDRYGVELVDELSKLCTGADFIIITGYASLDTAVLAVGHKKIIAYETKPLNMPLFLSFVKQVFERKKTEHDLKKAEIHYRLLAENIQDVIWTTDLNLNLTYLSPSGRQRLGIQNEDALPSIKNLVSPESFEITREAVRQALVEAYVSGKDVLKERYFEFELIIPDGSKIWTETRVSLLHNESGKVAGILGVTRDITERKRGREALHQSEASLLEAQRIAHMGNWEWDPVKKTIWSRELYNVFGIDPQQPVPSHKAWLNIVHPGDRERVEKALDSALNEGRPYSIDYRIISKDGRERIVHSEGETRLDRNGKPVRMVGAIQDITERKQAEEELRALSRRLVEMQESERRAIARELHDQIGQSLTALKLLLEKMRHEPTEAGWSEVRALADELMGQVRNLSLDLRPSMLDDLGLLPALVWHCDRFTAQTNIRVDLRHSGLEERLPQEVSTAAYRIVQEALTNVARHAGTKEVAVHVWMNGQALSLQVADKGRGFDLSALRMGSSTGLSSMRERALLLGGNLEIKSASGKGTLISASLPLPASSDYK